jgi:hemoglobin/transferrin/lactoferrin receptor protein
MLTAPFYWSDLRNIRGYRDMWGGFGRLRSDFDPQTLNFGLLRYEKTRAGFLENLTGTFSVNHWRDGSIRQNLRFTDPLIIDDTTVQSLGYSLFASKTLTSRMVLLFGGDTYRETVDASRWAQTPATGERVSQRAGFPNGSRYVTSGLFAQGTMQVTDRLRTTVAGSFNQVGAQTFADRNRDSGGQLLGVSDSDRTFRDWTYSAAVSWQALDSLQVHAVTARGFRAPNLSDLGTVGLTSAIFEVPSEEAAAAGGLLAADQVMERCLWGGPCAS